MSPTISDAVAIRVSTGVIRQDVLGRIARSAGPEIQTFLGTQAERGLFSATCRFTAEARDYADRIPARLVLIDGVRLAQPMMLHNAGVQEEEVFFESL